MPTNGALGNARQETAPDWFEPLTALRLCRILLNPHSIDRTHRTVATRQHRRHTRSRLSAPHGLRGSRQGLHARAPAHQSDHTTWRGSEEADKAPSARSRSPVRPLHMTGTGFSKRASPCIENRCFNLSQRAAPSQLRASPHSTSSSPALSIACRSSAEGGWKATSSWRTEIEPTCSGSSTRKISSDAATAALANLATSCLPSGTSGLSRRQRYHIQ